MILKVGGGSRKPGKGREGQRKSKNVGESVKKKVRDRWRKLEKASEKEQESGARRDESQQFREAPPGPLHWAASPPRTLQWPSPPPRTR